MKKAIFITVRTNSSRLPQKALLKIKERTTIEHLIRRVKNSKLADGIVLCTTTGKEDDILCNIAEQEAISWFRGSAPDKLERWNKTASKYHVEFFVTADGDDLFCEPALIDLIFKQYDKDNSDFIEPEGLVAGAVGYGIKTKALQKVCQIKDTEDTEMMWVYFKDTGLFDCQKLREVEAIYQRPEIRATLDYPDDFTFFKTVIENLSIIKKDFTLKDVIAYLDKHPEVIKIRKEKQHSY